MCSRFAASAQERGVATDQLGLLQNTVSDVDRAITVRHASTNHPNPPSPIPHSGPAAEIAPVRVQACGADELRPQQRVSAAGSEGRGQDAPPEDFQPEAAARGRKGAVHTFRAARPPSRHPLPHQICPANFG